MQCSLGADGAAGSAARHTRRGGQARSGPDPPPTQPTVRTLETHCQIISVIGSEPEVLRDATVRGSGAETRYRLEVKGQGRA